MAPFVFDCFDGMQDSHFTYSILFFMRSIISVYTWRNVLVPNDQWYINVILNGFSGSVDLSGTSVSIETTTGEIDMSVDTVDLTYQIQIVASDWPENTDGKQLFDFHFYISGKTVR